MSDSYFFSSLTRICDLKSCPFSVHFLPKEQWATGDYVVGEVISPLDYNSRIELTNGRMAQILEGDAVIGAFGVRRATLEAVGDWQAIASDNRMEALTAAGLFGRATSISLLVSPLTSLVYRGHVLRESRKVCMKDFVSPMPERPYNCPTIMIIGTSMSAGKTTAARTIVHQLKQFGLKVIGAKLTGAGRYRDILAMGDAGADRIFDFVDAGLPSSICPPEEFRQSLRWLLAAIAAEEPDVVVAEAGASPFEPYNGAIVLEEIKEQIRFTVLCASDPYAVVGVTQSFGLTPDLISGAATNTTAGIELVEKLTGVKAIALGHGRPLPDLMQILKEKLAL
jgi:molybdopterin-guanine dinucleotide biosynthesis protein